MIWVVPMALLQAVSLTPWVETHGYKIYRADGSTIEVLHTKGYGTPFN
jgi:hypothetical protein